MKKFECHEIEIEKFNLMDVITTSGDCEFHCNSDGTSCTNGTATASL